MVRSQTHIEGHPLAPWNIIQPEMSPDSKKDLIVTMDRFIELVHEYIRWYNEKRIKLSLGGLSPVEYRARLGLAA